MYRLIFICALLYGTTFAQEGFVQEDAHEHGAALLNVVLDGETLSMELESPAVNLVGFEYEPGTDEEVQAVEDALAKLKDGVTLFAPSEVAGCELMSAEAEHLMTDEEGHEEEHDKEGTDEHVDEMEAEHSEFRALYIFTCERADRLDSLDLAELFALYPGIEDLDVQYVLPSGQGAAELRPEVASLRF